MTWEEIDKAFDDIPKYIGIYVQLYAQDLEISNRLGRKYYSSFNKPTFADFDKLNKPLSKNSFDNVSVNYGTHLGIKKQYYNFWTGFKYYVNN
jgi:hypothetical protein